MQKQEMMGLGWPDQLPLDEGVRVAPSQADEEPEGETQTEVSEALRYMVEHALRFSRVKGFDDLLKRLPSYRQHRPCNALLLQLPATCCPPTGGSRTTAVGSSLTLSR